jgi:membrane associated rhomboid family serine protease
MGLADRHYMRQNFGGLHWSATVLLIITLVVTFFLQKFVLDPNVTARYAVLSLDGIKRGFVWQFVTFQFVHGGWIHLLLNCLVIYMFGREMEWLLGKARFLTLYFSSGAIGGLLQTMCGWIWPAHLGGGVVGASAGAFGLLAAFAMRDPERQLTMLLYFIIPIRMRARTLLLLSGIIAGLGMALPVLFAVLGKPFETDGIAHAAHLGGLLVGMAWIRLGWHHDYVRLPWEAALDRWRHRRPSKSRRPKGEPFGGPAGKALSRSIPKAETTDLPAEEFISREVDPILDKISAQGIQSLTERERRILDAARNRMAKR